jgi:polyferredoxin
MMRFIKEFLQFALREKKWWLVPLLLIVLVVGLLLFLSAGSGISWALYPSK